MISHGSLSVVCLIVAVQWLNEQISVTRNTLAEI
jgi:hypothetical protein